MSDKKEKVLIVHNYYQIPGGEDTVVANEKQLLEMHGHETVLYTRHNSELKSLSKFQKLLLPFSTIFSIRTYQEVKRIIKEEKIEIVHVHNTLNMVSPSVYYAAFSEKVPVIQTVHNFRLLCPGATFYRKGQICEECVTKGLMCAVKHRCYRGSRLQTLACVISSWVHRSIGTYQKLNYICLTEFNKKKLLELKQINPKNVYIKPNFVQPSDTIVPYTERKKQFVYVGRIEEIKGIRILLKAWKILGEKAPTLLVCGTGPLEEWANTYINTHRLENVQMLGFVENSKVRKLIAESTALILPTQVYEGFPMTIAESYACGTPVVGSDQGNTGSLIEEGVSGLKFRYDSSESLAEKIVELLRSPIEMNSEVIHKYSSEENYKLLRDIYEKCSDHHEYSSTLSS